MASSEQKISLLALLVAGGGAAAAYFLWGKKDQATPAGTTDTKVSGQPAPVPVVDAFVLSPTAGNDVKARAFGPAIPSIWKDGPRYTCPIGSHVEYSDDLSAWCVLNTPAPQQVHTVTAPNFVPVVPVQLPPLMDLFNPANPALTSTAPPTMPPVEKRVVALRPTTRVPPGNRSSVRPIGRRFIFVFLLLLLPQIARAQISYGVSNNGTNTYVIDTRGQGAFTVRLASIPAASGVTTCTVQVDGSSDNVTFGSADVLGSQSCTSRAAVISSLAAANWIRLNITQTGTGSVQFNVNVDKGTASGQSTAGQTTAANLTAAINSTPTLTEKGARWSQVDVSGSTARAAGAAGVRHVIDCVAFSAVSTAAVTATAVNVSLIDGATTIWRWDVAVQVAAGAGVPVTPPFAICGLNLIGSAATIITFRFGTAVTNAQETVSMSGYDVQ